MTLAHGAGPASAANMGPWVHKSHLESSAAAVAAEGGKAIMGVPLRAEGKVMGALVVAARHALQQRVFGVAAVRGQPGDLPCPARDEVPAPARIAFEACPTEPAHAYALALGPLRDTFAEG